MKKVAAYGLYIIAIMMLAWVVGVIIGESESDTAPIVVGVISTLLSVGFGLIVFMSTSKQGSESTIIAGSLSIILFLYILPSGIQSGYQKRVSALYTSYNKSFEQCSITELRVNEFREKMGLLPLKSEVFCR